MKPDQAPTAGVPPRNPAADAVIGTSARIAIHQLHHATHG
jgi:hypothetical protein